MSQPIFSSHLSSLRDEEDYKHIQSSNFEVENQKCFTGCVEKLAPEDEEK